MPGSIDRLDSRQAEVPDHRMMNERCDESAARGVDMNGNINATFFFKIIERKADRLHGLVLKCMRNPERSHDSDGLLIAAFENFFRRHMQALRLARHMAEC